MKLLFCFMRCCFSTSDSSLTKEGLLLSSLISWINNFSTLFYELCPIFYISDISISLRVGLNDLMMDYIWPRLVNLLMTLQGHGDRWTSLGELKQLLLKLRDFRWKFFLYSGRYSEQMVSKVLVIMKQCSSWGYAVYYGSMEDWWPKEVVLPKQSMMNPYISSPLQKYPSKAFISVSQIRPRPQSLPYLQVPQEMGHSFLRIRPKPVSLEAVMDLEGYLGCFLSDSMNPTNIYRQLMWEYTKGSLGYVWCEVMRSDRNLLGLMKILAYTCSKMGGKRAESEGFLAYLCGNTEIFGTFKALPLLAAEDSFGYWFRTMTSHQIFSNLLVSSATNNLLLWMIWHFPVILFPSKTALARLPVILYTQFSPWRLPALMEPYMQIAEYELFLSYSSTKLGLNRKYRPSIWLLRHSANRKFPKSSTVMPSPSRVCLDLLGERVVSLKCRLRGDCPKSERL